MTVGYLQPHLASEEKLFPDRVVYDDGLDLAEFILDVLSVDPQLLDEDLETVIDTLIDFQQERHLVL